MDSVAAAAVDRARCVLYFAERSRGGQDLSQASSTIVSVSSRTNVNEYVVMRSLLPERMRPSIADYDFADTHAEYDAATGPLHQDDADGQTGAAYPSAKMV